MSRELNYAGYWRRAVAFLLDAFLLLFPILPIQMLAVVARTINEHKLADLLSFFGVVIVWLYFAISESSKLQATFGKWAVGLKVVDWQGERVDFKRATFRHFLKYVSVLPLLIGFFMAGWTKKKQGLHDIVSFCLVLREDQSKIGDAFRAVKADVLKRTLDESGKINAFGYGGMLLVVLVLCGSIVYLNSGYRSYDACILDKMPNANTTIASHSIRRACKNVTK